jgi:radical SAM protein with 4Fe4S-binding SPASM domain
MEPRLTISSGALQKQLESQFELICFVDLADVCSTHSAIFSLLKSIHREEYLGNQRLVFYSSHKLSLDFINHLQLAASRIDISNFFILICSPNDIKKELDIANNVHGHDSVAMSWLPAELVETAPLLDFGFYPRTSFCPLPFGSLFVDIPGRVSPCCKFEGEVGNINNNSLNEIFHNKAMTTLRAQMKDGIQPNACRVCWDVEKNGVTSLRLHAIDKYQDQNDHGWIDNLKIRDISISPSTLCNFKCRICNSYSSSQIAVEELKHTTDPGKISYLKGMLKLTNWDSSYFEQSLQELDYDFDHLHVMGGEPFLLPELAGILEKVIKSGNSKKMQLEFNTNGSQFSNKIIKLFNQFKKVEVLLSIDNIGPRFEIERGGLWSAIKENISQFAKINSETVSVKLAITVNIQNLLYLDELVEFARQEKFGIVWWYLETPSYLCIDNVTQLVKDLVYKKYHGHHIPELQKISNRVQLAKPVSGQTFINHMNQFDQRRGQQFSQTHLEIFNAMSNQSE